jgi:hypothetical protein
VQDVRLGVLSAIRVSELFREAGRQSKPRIDVVEAGYPHDRLEPLRFSVSRALLACSETPMILAASRALQWWK